MDSKAPPHIDTAVFQHGSMDRQHAGARNRKSCQSRSDLSAGFLNSEQAIEWDGPPLPARLIPLLPEQMDREHFAAVGASALRLVSLRLDTESVRCSIPGGISLLRFGSPTNELTPTSATRTWVITGGRLARVEPSYGSITFTWTMQPLGDNVWRHRLAARVDGYPSRFIPAHATRNPLRRTIARLYAWYHGVVTCRYLKRLSRSLREESRETAT